MGRVVARSVAQVVAGEAVHGTRDQRLADMKAIASVISNRAKALGVTQQQVVANQNEFNAYGKALPKGVESYVGLAKEAINDVELNGPVHKGTFYATPKAAKNLPKGLTEEVVTTGHRFFSDPKARAIGTAIGYKTPDLSALAQTAVAALPANVPAPSFAQRDIGGLLAPSPQVASALAPTPALSPAQAAINGALSPTQEANLASRLGPTAPAPTKAALNAAQEANLASRLGVGVNPSPPSMPTKKSLTAAQDANLASRLGPAPAQPSAPAKKGLSQAQEANLASRLGDMDAAKAQNVTSRLDAAQAPAPSMSIGGLLGVSPAAAATMNAPAKAAAAAPKSAPVSTGFAGPIGSPRSMEATVAGPTFGNRYASAPAAPAAATAALASTPSPAKATTNFAGSIGNMRAAEEQSMASLNAQEALNAGMFSKPSPVKSATALSPEAALAADVAEQRKATGLPALSTPRTVSAPPATYNAPTAVAETPSYTNSYAPSYSTPQSIEGAVGRNRQEFSAGYPSIPDAPSPFSQATTQIGSALSRNKGRLAGGLLGAAAFGPVGGLLGGMLGSAVQRGMSAQPSEAARMAAANGTFDGFAQNTGWGLGGLGGNGFSAAVNAAALNEGFDGFGYSGAASSNRPGGGSGGPGGPIGPSRGSPGSGAGMSGPASGDGPTGGKGKGKK